MSMSEDFKKFAFKGNVVDLAVGVIIGAAFGKIVAALVADLIMPLVALIMPSGDWRASGIILRAAADPKDSVILKYGDFLGALVDFGVIAVVLFLIVSKIMSRIPKKEEAATTKACAFCLEQIPLKATKCKACASTV
ncbi:large conductance mechanosensitive channel protein MscL [soil metagenome]